jgi:hypothetical protein
MRVELIKGMVEEGAYFVLTSPTLFLSREEGEKSQESGGLRGIGDLWHIGGEREVMKR